MINSVTITDLSKATEHSYKTNKTQNLWISVNDPEDERKIKRIKSNLRGCNIPHFHQFFRDWSDEDPEPFIQNFIEQQGPSEAHVNNIISFLEVYVYQNKPFDLGINCLAGVSRSTAIGIIAWVMEGKKPLDALEAILKVRRQAWPNLRILRFASARLNKDLFNPILDWKQQNRNGLFI
jgi:predicted protein tyrosine phosphatase